MQYTERKLKLRVFFLNSDFPKAVKKYIYIAPDRKQNRQNFVFRVGRAKNSIKNCELYYMNFRF